MAGCYYLGAVDHASHQRRPTWIVRRFYVYWNASDRSRIGRRVE